MSQREDRNQRTKRHLTASVFLTLLTTCVVTNSGRSECARQILQKVPTTAEPIRLTRTADDDGEPIWSPDGKRLVFYSTQQARPRRHHRRSRHDDAMTLIWNQFVEWPLKNYQELKAHALKVRPDPDWPAWRETSADPFTRCY